MFLIGEHSVEECYDFRVAVSWNWVWIGVEWVWRIVNASERIVVHVVEALVVPSDPSVEYCNNRASSV